MSLVMNFYHSRAISPSEAVGGPCYPSLLADGTAICAPLNPYIWGSGVGTFT